MSTLIVTLTGQCAGGNHLTVSSSVNGVSQLDLVMTTDELTDPMTPLEVKAFVKGIMRLHKLGKTLAQMKTDALAGITVTI